MNNESIVFDILRDYCENKIEVTFDAVYNAVESLGFNVEVHEPNYKPYGIPTYRELIISEYDEEVLSINLIPVKLNSDDKWYIHCAICTNFDKLLSEKWVNSEFENEEMNERYIQYKNGVLIV